MSTAIPDALGDCTELTICDLRENKLEGEIPPELGYCKKLQKLDLNDNTLSGKIPEDILNADNDSVLQAQIRQAAINEKDPKVRAKLWNEYRKYKGKPQVD